MSLPTRKTRRFIAYWAVGVITSIVLWVMLPGDIGQIEQALMMVIVPSVIGIVIAFISGETYSDHSERKHKND